MNDAIIPNAFGPSVPIAVSLGDPAGIGPDIVLTAVAQATAENPLPPFFVIGDPDVLRERATALGLAITIVSMDTAAAAGRQKVRLSVEPAVVSVLPMPTARPVVAGTPDSGNAGAIVGAIDAGVEWVLSGRASALVTCPIAKSVLYASGFAFPGHTEYLAHLAERATGRPVHPVMMIASPEVRTVPVTIHIPLKDVPEALSTDLILSTLQIVAADLRTRAGIARPRLAVAGLNPHAGEDGALGLEDQAVVAPAIAAARAQGIDAFGPLPADTMFHPAARRGYDAAICMYHDQALIPAKTLAFDEGVNVTLGLPFIRTSPDHGTAFSLAGTGKARPDSFIAALRMADELARTQARSAHGATEAQAS